MGTSVCYQKGKHFIQPHYTQLLSLSNLLLLTCLKGYKKKYCCFKKTGCTLILLEHSMHLQSQTSFDSSHSSWFLFLGFFLFRSPYTIGMWVGGCCSTSNSIWYSCFSHLIVRGRRFHGPTLSIADRTLKRQATQDSLVFLLKT